MSEKSLVNKKVVMIPAFRYFQDEEYFIPKLILEQAGAEVKTASNKMGVAVGVMGGEAAVDFLVEDLRPADFDAVIFVGGGGCTEYLDNEKSYRVARETVEAGKILAAICISPVVLAKAGVLKGKKATVWCSVFEQSPIEVLEAGGATYQDVPVVVDGKIITADGPEVAAEFGRAILEALSK
jgi:protease I